MGNYNRDNRGGNRGFGRRDFGPREMFKAVCGKCGKDCEVPFRPSGDRPVFCSECFQNSRGQNDSRNFQDRGPRPSFQRPQNNEQLSEISRKLDRIIEMLTVKPANEAIVEIQEKAAEVKVEEVAPVIEEKVKPVSKRKTKSSKKE